MNHNTISVWAGTLILCSILVFGLYQAKGWVVGVQEELARLVQDTKLLLEGLDELLERSDQLERVAEAESPPPATPAKKPAGVEKRLAENLSTRYKIYYRTKDGEDLGQISEKFDISEDQLRLWNALKPTDTLIPGQVVVINKSTDRQTVVARTSPPPDTGTAVARREKAAAEESESEEERSESRARTDKEPDETPGGGTIVDETESLRGAGESMAAEKEQTTTESAGAGTGEPVGEIPGEPGEGIVHTVQEGETLSEIGQEYGISWQILAEQNQITHPETIYEGQRLRIGMDTASSTDEITHIVQAGENLYRIGLRYGISWEEIARKNNILNATRLLKGQALKIPLARGGPELSPEDP